jgi:hypothetical protein
MNAKALFHALTPLDDSRRFNDPELVECRNAAFYINAHKNRDEVYEDIATDFLALLPQLLGNFAAVDHAENGDVLRRLFLSVGHNLERRAEDRP